VRCITASLQKGVYDFSLRMGVMRMRPVQSSRQQRLRRCLQCLIVVAMVCFLLSPGIAQTSAEPQSQVSPEDVKKFSGMFTQFGLPAIAKGALVFVGVVLLSWGATAALRRIPAIARMI
jgi:hypothetical protein